MSRPRPTDTPGGLELGRAGLFAEVLAAAEICHLVFVDVRGIEVSREISTLLFQNRRGRKSNRTHVLSRAAAQASSLILSLPIQVPHERIHAILYPKH
jgi:hypothetical protein